jgi:hypothetical protein
VVRVVGGHAEESSTLPLSDSKQAHRRRVAVAGRA